MMITYLNLSKCFECRPEPTMATTSTETNINEEQTNTTTCQQQQHHQSADAEDVDVDFTIPLQRQWHYAHPDTTTENTPNASGSGFSVVHYNILADCALPENGIPHCPKEWYKDTQRLPQLLRELDHHLPDILCLQEVSCFFFFKCTCVQSMIKASILTNTKSYKTHIPTSFRIIHIS